MRNLIRTGVAAALLASATLVGGIAGGHAFAAGNCPASATSTSDYCTAQTSVTVTGNSVALTLANLVYQPFVGKTLNGGVQSTTSDYASGYNSVTVTDQSGSGLGWNLTVQATPLKCTSGTDPGCVQTHQLNPTDEAMTTGAIDTLNTSCVATPCRGAPTAGSSGQIDNITSPSTGVKVASAAANTGMGQYSVRLGALTANLTADMYASTYHSTVTVTLTQGP